MRKSLLLVILFIVTVSFSGCVQKQNSENGFLEGKITIGPLCPVERNPPDPRCQANEETYRSWPIAIYTGQDNKTKIAQIEPYTNGTYKIQLPAGKYTIDLEKQHMFGKNLPTTVIIKKEEITLLNIDIDTGIR